MVIRVDVGYSFKIIVIKKRLNFIHFPREIFWLNLIFLISWICCSQAMSCVQLSRAGPAVFAALEPASTWARCTPNVWPLSAYKQQPSLPHTVIRWHLLPRFQTALIPLVAPLSRAAAAAVAGHALPSGGRFPERPRGVAVSSLLQRLKFRGTWEQRLGTAHWTWGGSSQRRGKEPFLKGCELIPYLYYVKKKKRLWVLVFI